MIATHPDSKLIDKAGGTVKVARLCQVAPPSVSEWRTKGIPRARRMFLALLLPDIFLAKDGLGERNQEHAA